MRSQQKEFMGGRAVGKCSVSNSKSGIEDVEFGNALEGLPADSKEAWEAFDRKLRADKKYALEVALEIKDQCYGLTDIRDYVRHAMTLVITNACASEYSFCGRLEKAAFRGMYFVKLIQWILVKHTSFPKKKGEVKSIISDWLRLAEQRLGGRKFSSRKKKRPVQPLSESGQEDTPRKSPGRSTSTPKRKRLSKRKSADDSNDIINLDDIESFSEMVSPIKRKVQRRLPQQTVSDTSRDEADAEEGDFADFTT